MGFGLIQKEFSLCVESYKWCVELPAMAYTNQKAVSSYILLRIKHKPPSAKTRSRRFPDVMGGMDSGFSLGAAPAFCRGPGISKIRRYMRVLQVAGNLQGRRMRWKVSGGA